VRWDAQINYIGRAREREREREKEKGESEEKVGKREIEGIDCQAERQRERE